MWFSTEFQKSLSPCFSTIALWIGDDDFAWLVMNRTLASVDLMTGLLFLEHSFFLLGRLLLLRLFEGLSLALLLVSVTHHSYPTELDAQLFAQSGRGIAW